MQTFKATVRVMSPNGVSTMVEWAEVRASNPIAARSMLEGQYGRGNVIGVPAVVR